MINDLPTAIQPVEMVVAFTDVLDEGQLDDVYCKALILSASITEYLASGIIYLSGTICFLNLQTKPFTAKWKVGSVGKSDFSIARQKIVVASHDYSSSMVRLNATMTMQVLRYDQIEKRQKMLEWLSAKNDWETHNKLQSDRISDTGNWFLDSQDFKAWKRGEGSPILICHGLGIKPCQLC